MEVPGPSRTLRSPCKFRVGRDCPLIIEGFEPGLVAKGTMRGQQKLSLKGQQRGSQVWGGMGLYLLLFEAERLGVHQWGAGFRFGEILETAGPLQRQLWGEAREGQE